MLLFRICFVLVPGAGGCRPARFGQVRGHPERAPLRGPAQEIERRPRTRQQPAGHLPRRADNVSHFHRRKLHFNRFVFSQGVGQLRHKAMHSFVEEHQSVGPHRRLHHPPAAVVALSVLRPGNDGILSQGVCCVRGMCRRS
jgi:hypothetical protein